MSSPLVAVADIECPNCSKLALLEGQPMATIPTSDFLLLTKPHWEEMFAQCSLARHITTRYSHFC